MQRDELLTKINKALDALYLENSFLFENDLCERCINYKFALNLEKQQFLGYHVDCEYNQSYLNGETDLKRVSNKNGNYIDIIITKRDKIAKNDLVCFEIKKWNNKKNREKDRQNLTILTDQSHFAYKFGIYIIYGKTRQNVQIEVYQAGQQK